MRDEWGSSRYSAHQGWAGVARFNCACVRMRECGDGVLWASYARQCGTGAGLQEGL